VVDLDVDRASGEDELHVALVDAAERRASGVEVVALVGTHVEDEGARDVEAARVVLLVDRDLAGAVTVGRLRRLLEGDAVDEVVARTDPAATAERRGGRDEGQELKGTDLQTMEEKHRSFSTVRMRPAVVGR